MWREVKFLFSVSLVAAGVETAFMITRNGLVPADFDWLVLFSYILAIYLVLSSVVIAMIAFLAPGSRDGGQDTPRKMRIRGFLLLFCGYVFAINIGVGLLRQDLLDYPPAEHGGIITTYGMIFFALTFVFLLSYRKYDKLRTFFTRIRLNPLRFAVVALLVIAVSLLVGTSRDGDAGEGGSTQQLMAETGSVTDTAVAAHHVDRPKIVIVGLDCLNLETVDRLSGEGRLPNLKKLIDQGASGNLGTIMPTLSPMLWTSIGTGKTEKQHGIHDFRTVRIPGVRPFPTTLKRVRFTSVATYYILRNDVLPEGFFHFHHYTSGMRTCKSLWNILSEHELQVGVIGWYITWPAEPVNGFLVTSRSFLYSNHGDMEIDPGLTYPESLFGDISVHNDLMENITLDSLAWLCEQSGGGDPDIRTGCIKTVERFFQAIRKNYARDLITLNVTLDMMDRYDTLDVLMVYFRAVDSLNHIVFNDTHYGQSSFGDELYIIPDNYYEFIDRMVGRICLKLDDDTILIIVSDHGWDRANGHPYAPPGTIIMNGKYVEKGCVIEGADLYDVVPTVLYLSGLPVAKDMVGRPLISCIDRSYNGTLPLRYVSTYEEGTRTARFDPDKSSVDDQIDEQLKALGYIE